MGNEKQDPAETCYGFEVEDASGLKSTLEEFHGDVLLIVNTASKCGLTPQFKGLERLHQRYQKEGLRVLAFPCNQFGGQEPGEAEEVRLFCETHYSVTFPIYGKVNVNGKSAHPLFLHLKEQAPGLMGTKSIKWNFTKFLVNRRGVAVQRFGPKNEPEALVSVIETLLGEK